MCNVPLAGGPCFDSFASCARTAERIWTGQTFSARNDDRNIMKSTAICIIPRGTCLSRHVPRIQPRGRSSKGAPGCPPNQKLFGFGPLFFGRGPILRTKKSKIFRKMFGLGFLPDSYKDPVTSKFEPHGLQNSPKALFPHPLGYYVAPGANGIQRSRIDA